MMSDLGIVLDALYAIEREKPRYWVTVTELHDKFGNLLFALGELVSSLRKLEANELAVRHPDHENCWRINRQFCADLDEWGERVLEALDSHPHWLILPELGQLVRQETHANVDNVMLTTILSHLRETRGNIVEVDLDAVRIRLSEWVKRCQAQAHSS